MFFCSTKLFYKNKDSSTVEISPISIKEYIIWRLMIDIHIMMIYYQSPSIQIIPHFTGVWYAAHLACTISDVIIVL
jgi:hypothetical protein